MGQHRCPHGQPLRPRRASIAAVGLLGLLGSMAFGAAPPAAAAAPAQDGAPASQGASAPAATLDVAKATALVAEYAPTVGSLKLAIASGISVAEVRNHLAQAQSQTLDLGLIGSSLTAQQCNGDDGSVREEDLPHPVRVDNRGGDAEIEEASYPVVPAFVEGGVSTVRATVQPLAEAISTTGRVTAGPARIDGGRATTTTEVLDDGLARLATAEVDLDVEIPGVLRMRGLHWEASHRTGTDPAASGTFHIGAVEILGLQVPTDGLPADQVVDGINTVLVPLGLTVIAPTEERVTEPNDFVRVTPLQIRFAESPIALVLDPMLAATRMLRDDLAALANDVYCKTSNALLVGEILLGQLSGIGSSTISLGGVEATSAALEVGNPFGSEPLLAPALDLPVAGGGLPAPPVAPRPSVAPVAAAPIAATPTAPVTQPIGSFERVCRSVHAFDWPSCSEGAGPFVGLGALAATGLIGALDWRHQRRRRLAAATGPGTGR